MRDKKTNHQRWNKTDWIGATAFAVCSLSRNVVLVSGFRPELLFSDKQIRK
jgi:hypothetical protein